MQFTNLKTPEELKKFNTWLESHSYVDGYVPSKSDFSAFDQFGSEPNKELVNVFRWFNHIKSFTGAERKSFIGCAAGDSASDSKNTAKNDDDFDLFGDEDEDDEEKEKIKQERLKAYEEKKSKKPALVAKSSIILDIKPWDDECDLKEMEKRVREISCDGLLWAKEAKILPVAFGIKKLQIGCVVEDDKVGVDFLEENIIAIEELVQSVDIVAFNKV